MDFRLYVKQIEKIVFVVCGKDMKLKRKELVANPLYVADADLLTTTDLLQKHIMTCFHMLREAKWEDGNQTGTRRFPKSGGLRKRCNKEQMMEELQCIMDKMIDVEPSSYFPHIPPSWQGTLQRSMSCPALMDQKIVPYSVTSGEEVDLFKDHAMY